MFEVEIHYSCIKDPGNMMTMVIHTSDTVDSYKLIAQVWLASLSVNSVLTFRMFWSRTVFP